MVAIVSGNSLGLDLTSLRTLGPQDFTGSAAHGRNGQGVYVNAANGNLVVQGLEANVATAGADVQGLRTYNSQGLLDDDSGVGGDNWSHGTFLQPLKVVGTPNTPGSEIHVTNRDGSVARFSWSEEYSFYLGTDGDGPHDSITLNASTGLYTWRDGATGAHRRYEADGLHRLVSTGDPSGNVLTYSYTGARLDKIVDAAGNGTRYDYDAGTGLLKGLWTVEGGADKAQRVFYEYDTSNRLAKVTVDLSPEQAGIADGDVYWTEYTYHGEEQDYRLATIRQKDGTSLSFAYEDNGSGRIASVTDALGGVTEFRYNGVTTTVEDALGRITAYEKDAQGQLKSITAPTSGGVTPSRSFTYDGDGNVTSVVDGEGRTTTYSHDVWGRVTLETDGAGKRIEREYDDRHQLTVERVLQQADADGTGPIVEVVAVTRQVWDVEVRGLLRFVVSAEGRVTEHRYDAARQRETTIVYLADRYTTGTGALSESTMEAWAAQRAPAARQRIDMTYLRGELATRTTYASVDAAGKGVVGTESTERFVYDDAGRLLQSFTATGHATTYTYDGLGRVEKVTNALGQTAITEYQDTGGKIVHTLAHGFVSTEAYDLAGRLITSVASGGGDENLGTTRNYYDANGRLRMTQDPTGRRQWILYTAAGQKAAEVDANGTMKEWGYDAGGRVTWMREYATAIDMTRLPVPAGTTVADQVAGDLRPVTTIEDYRAWYAYDGAGRLVRSAETVGTSTDVAVTERRYDAAGRLEREIRYAKAEPLTSSDITLPGATQQDRVTRYFYDRDGLLRGTLDGEGFLTELRYDNKGQLEQRIAYANPTPLADRNAQALAGALPTADAAKDIRTYYFHDGHGRRIGELDGERYLTEHEYDSNGRLLKTLRYLQPVTGPITTLDAARPLAGEAKTQASYLYDALGRVTTEINAEDTWTRYRYDVAGNLTSTTRAYNTDEARTSATRYDLLGRVTEELAPLDYARIRSTMSDAEKDAIWAQYATKHTYDAAGRHIRTTDALGRKTLYFYDADGALVYTVDPLGRIKEKVYDVRGRLVEEVERLGTISMTGLYGGSVPQALLDRMAAADQADDFSTKYAYTRDGRVTTVTSPTGNLTTTAFNAFGEASSRVQGMGGTGPDRVEAYAYDRRGLRVQTLRDEAGLAALEKTELDAFGRVVSTTDAAGGVRQRAYDRLGRVVQTTDATSSKRYSTYDAFNRVLTQSDALGNVTTFTYDVAERTVTMRTPEGIVTKTASNRHGEVIGKTDGMGQVTEFSYDRNGRLVTTTTPLTTETTTYDLAGRVETTLDANGTQVKYTYDAVDRVKTRTVDPDGLALTTTYDYDGRDVRVTDPMGTVTLTSYDKKGRVATQVVDEGGLDLKTTYTYNPADETLTVTAPGGTVTSYGYDALGRRTSETVDPGGLNLVRSWTYDDAGHLLTSRDARGFLTRYVNDAEGRVRYAIDPTGGVAETRYDAEGRVRQTVQWARAISLANLGTAPTAAEVVARLGTDQPSAETQHRVYDGDGRLVATVNANGSVVRYTLDKNGRVTSQRAYAARISMPDWERGTVPLPTADASRDVRQYHVYDALGRALYTMDGLGGVTARTYDGNGNVLTEVAYATRIPMSTPLKPAEMAAALELVRDADHDRSIRNVYDAAGRLRWSVDGTGAVTQRAYDRNGNLVSLVQHATALPEGAAISSVASSSADRRTTMAYDAAGRMRFQVDALLGVTEQVFDQDGNVLRSTRHATPIDSLPTVGQPGTADAIRSRLAAPTSQDRTTSHEYDAASRVVRTISPAGAHTTTVYDGAGNVIRRTAHATLWSREESADDRVTRFAYDGAGRLVFTVDAGGALEELAYDAIGRLTGRTRYANRPALGSGDYGVSTIQGKVVANNAIDQAESYEYNAAGHLVKTTDALGISEQYGHDGIGNRVTFINKKGDTWTYSYDAAGRLKEEVSPVVALAWQATAGSVAVSFADAPVVTRMAYDALGQLVSRTEAAGRPEERTTTFGYDAAGRQVLVSLGWAPVYDAASDTLATSGTVGPAEKSVKLDTVTFYDTLGNAVANVDAHGALSQKVYDAMGRVAYEVDAEGYITGYERNAFGEVRVLTRYGHNTNLEVRTVSRASQAVTLAAIEARLVDPAVDHTYDRTLTTTYDRAGRTTQVLERSAQIFDPTATGADQWTTARKTTATIYNAFGEAVESRSLRNAVTSDWSVTTRFYDRNGRETATVDAKGYLTSRGYDAFGNLVVSIEYSNAVLAGWSKEGYTRGEESIRDRRTEYGYDRGNRKVLERRVDVEYSTASNGTSERGDLVTKYVYDAVGNQTATVDADSRWTYTYYDALGRVSAVVQSQMGAVTPAGGAETASVHPVTSYLRDAHGNVLREMRRANGATAVTLSGFTEGEASSLDRYVRTRYDRLGRAIHVNDARGFDQYFSYDAAGRVAKMWREVGDGRITYEVNIYDKLGQLLDVRRPRTTMEVQGGITARWAAAPWVNTGVSHPEDGPDLEVGWTGLEGTRVRVEVTYTTVAYSITTPGSGSEEPTTTPYPAKTLTVTQERTAADAAGGMTVAFQDPVAKIEYIRVRELKGTNWVVRWEGTYGQAQGSGVTEVDQSVVGQTFTSTRYNGFGEVVLRGTNGDLAEYFDYDAAGRLWRTNSGDGVDKVYLYDAQGNRTSEIRSAGIARGNVDLQLVASAAEAHGDTSARRTDYVYDALGRLVQQTEAARQELQGGLSVRELKAEATIVNVGQPVPIGYYSGDQWQEGEAQVKLTWTNLTTFGSGDVKVKVTYRTADTLQWGAGGTASYQSAVYESHEAAQGITLNWTTKPIAAITEITVSKKNSNGNWTEVIRQAPGTNTYLVDLDAASNRWAPEYLEYRVAGSSAEWTRAALTDFGDRAAWFGGRTLAAGTYEYRIGVQPQGQDPREVGTGTLTVTASGAITQQTADNNGNVWLRPVVKQTLDRWGNVVALTDPRSEDWKTVYAYNASNQMILQRLPRADGVQASTNPATQIYYDKVGRQVAVRDALGNVNGSVYDGNGNLLREIHADGGTVHHRYNVFGEKVETTDARGKVQAFTYDKGGNLVKVDKGSASVFQVDTNQELLDTGKKPIVESWTYDALGRRTSQTNGEGEKTSYRYDLLGNLIEWTQPMGQKSYAAYDRQGRKIAEVDANGYEATWQFDYFGQLLAHTDLGAATYHYTYDNARQLLTQTNSRGQDLSYKYDAVGQVTEIRDQQEDQPLKITTYAYDLGGRRLIEKTTSGGLVNVYQDNRLAYDAQGKLRDVSDNRVRMQFTYDANGNRLSVRTTLRYAGMTGEVAKDTTRYFKYDAMNRQTVVDADDAAGLTGADRHEIVYDENGNRVEDTYTGFAVTKDANGDWTVYDDKVEVREKYVYDDLNRLLSVKRNDQFIDLRNYDAADRVMKSGNVLPSAYREELERLLEAGHVAQPNITINRYDANGRLLHQTVKGPNNVALQEISWDPNEVPHDMPASMVSAFRAEGYDHAGNVKGYTVFTHQGSTTNKYSTTLERYEGYVGTRSTVRSSDGDVGTNAQVYDDNGHLVQVDDNHLTGYGRVFVNDAEGRALYVRRDDKEERQFIANGEVLGRYGIGPHELAPVDGAGYPNFTNIADFNFSYAPVSPTYPAPSPGAYIVKVGDTLQTVAKGAYGDAALWYRIAEANGLSSNDAVRVGQVLNIPNRVGTIHNNDGTFKPYDPSRITGDVSPHLAMPGEKGCGAAGQLLMVIVAVAVTALTGFGGVFLSQGANAVAQVAAAAASGAIGGAAGQAVGLVTGTIDRFDWKGVAISGIAAGATVGVSIATGVTAATVGGATTAAPFWTSTAGTVVRAAIANGITQGIATATGLQDHFNWAGVAAAGIGAGVGSYVGKELGLPADGSRGNMNAGEFLGKSIVKAFAAGAATAVARGGRIAVQQVAIDAFGNALGESIASASSGDSTRNPSSIDYENEMDRQSDAAYYAEQQAELYRTGGNFARMDGASYRGMPAVAPALVNGLTFSEDAALRGLVNDPYRLRNAGDMAPQVDGPAVLDMAQAQDKWVFTGRKPIYDFGDPFEAGGEGPLAQVRVARGSGVRPAMVNGVSVNSKAEALLNAAAEGDISGMGNLYRDYKLLGALMNDGARDSTLRDLKKQLQDRLGVMRTMPSEETLGARMGIGSDGVTRYDKADLIDRYADALRKVGLAQQGVIELDYKNFEVRTIGNAKLSPAQYLAEVETRYQRAFVRGVELGEERYARGELRYPADMPKQLQVGLFADDFGKRALLTYHGAIGVSEGPGQIISLNRWSYDPGGTGLYIRNDVLVDLGPGQRYWVDGKGSLMEAQNSSKQFQTFHQYTATVRGKVVTPQGMFEVLPNGRIGGRIR